MIGNLIAWLIIVAIVLMPIALFFIWVAGMVYVTRAIIVSLRSRLSDRDRCSGPSPRRTPIPVKIRATKFINVVLITVGGPNHLGPCRCRWQAAAFGGRHREHGAEISISCLTLNSIRINDQWRICFVWKGGEAWDVEVVDYH